MERQDDPRRPGSAEERKIVVLRLEIEVLDPGFERPPQQRRAGRGRRRPTLLAAPDGDQLRLAGCAEEPVGIEVADPVQAQLDQIGAGIGGEVLPARLLRRGAGDNLDDEAAGRHPILHRGAPGEASAAAPADRGRPLSPDRGPGGRVRC